MGEKVVRVAQGVAPPPRANGARGKAKDAGSRPVRGGRGSGESRGTSGESRGARPSNRGNGNGNGSGRGEGRSKNGPASQ